MTIPQRVYAYYTRQFDQLTDDKRFHFASRMSAWSNDNFSKTYLEAISAHYLGSDEKIKNDLSELLHNPPKAKINAAKTRQQYFDAYPELRGRMLALFRVRHLLTIYGVDARPLLLELVSKQELYEMSEALQKDDDALRILSTYAINFIYLVEVILFAREQPLPLAHFIELGGHYDTNNPEDVQLLIYFYTHCIIGASNFYAHHVSRDETHFYKAMLQELELRISKNFMSINLDNKLEYLVCCRIVGFPTMLTDAIYDECAQSFSPEGDFVIDTINTFKQSKKTSFSDSEHRNVLLIMGASDYSPLS